MKRSVIALPIRHLVLLFFFSSLFSGSSLADEVSAPSLPLSKLRSCDISVAKALPKKKSSYWRACIAVAKKRYYHEAPTEAIRMEAISELIDFYHRLGNISANPSDRNKEDYWRRLQSEGLARNPVSALPNTVVNLRHSLQGKHLRVVLDLQDRAIYETHENREANLLQIDFVNAKINANLEKKSYTLGRKEMKAELEPQEQKTRLSLLNIPYDRFHISQLNDPHRWVIDFQLSEIQKVENTPHDQPPLTPFPKKTVEDFNSHNQGIRKIMIDPGHGGKDPGAVGLGGYSEKEAVLDIGLRLKELLLKSLKVEVMMTRSNDVFIPLGERTKMANEANVDLFISIHANSSPHRTTRGVEIYLLGKSSDKRALRTAARENNVSEEEASQLDQNLVSIKKDLFQEYKKGESLELAHATRSSFMNRLRPSYPVVDLGVKTAPFYVLINTSMPSILAEVSFISNPAEEQRLKNRSYRQLMAESLLEGITKFIAANSNPSVF